MTFAFSGKRDVYKQIAERYEQYIRLGVLKDGDWLPSVRAAASELGVNPNTVQRAYTLLEEKGMIRTVQKKGVFVIAGVQDGAKATADLQPLMRELRHLKACGVTHGDILHIIEEVYTHD